ncbi:phospholipase D-like domain-containing protein [Denitromonas iodatirespirans]|uniref:Phospholipase D family protein n=1 Tax=Denitromonas iodatirespirans TaxID=2795389 RepID=A0A944DEK1_DENI1|nr:phospholipase D family protein [Denitromonas iodatirespirans]MBT0964107.1 phospholipase D family protein [Denitromonas iodatirespirans]
MSTLNAPPPGSCPTSNRHLTARFAALSSIRDVASQACVWLSLGMLALLTACTTLPPGADAPRIESYALAHPEQTRLGRHFEAAAAEHRGRSGFRIIANGIDGFLVRMQMIDAAERTIDLQYFIFRGDQTGWLLTQAVLRAADRGVRVRILVDDVETPPGDERLTALQAHPAVQIRIFNPFAYRGSFLWVRALEFLLNANRLDYRMHNKLFVIDNTVALLGGRNIGNEYFQVVPGTQFADEDVFVAGPISHQLSATFDEYWNSDLSIPVEVLNDTSRAPREKRQVREAHEERQALKDLVRQVPAKDTDYLARVENGEPLSGLISGRIRLEWAQAQVICDRPDKKDLDSDGRVGILMQQGVFDTAAAAMSEVLIVTPYLIPGDEGMRMIERLRARGIRVRILTNSLESSNVLVAHSGYMSYRTPLLQLGAELYESRSLLAKARGSGQAPEISRFGSYSLHTKLFVFDRRKMLIGSMNFDQRSMYLNTEIGILIHSPALAIEAARRFEAMVQPVNSYRLALRPDPNGGEPQLIWLTQEGGRTMVYDTEPARSDAQRAKAQALSLLPLDDEL